MKYTHRVLAPIVILNILVFLVQSSGYDLYHVGALWSGFHPNYRHWQWFSHIFLHSDLFHIALNLYGICIFAPMIIERIGAIKFYLLYFISALLGGLCYWGWNALNIILEPNTMLSLAGQHAVGASSSVFGILMAFVVLYPNAPLAFLLIPIAIKAKYLISGILFYEAFAQITGYSLFGNNIAHLAHLGGALAGGVLMWWWIRPRSITTPKKPKLRLVK